jgi:hypothetical protein
VNILKTFILSFAFGMLLLTAFAYEMLAWHYNWVVCLNVDRGFATWALDLFYRLKGFDWGL